MASLARRALPALALAGAAGVMTQHFDHPDELELTASAAVTPAVPSPPVVSPPSTTTPSTIPSTTLAPRLPQTGERDSARGLPSSAQPGTPATTAAPPATTPASCTGAEVLGPAVSTRFGPVQVAAILSNGRVCDVRAVQVPSGDRRSVSINSFAVPVLREKVLASQSAHFDNVSGATVTTAAYQASLQAILDQKR